MSRKRYISTEISTDTKVAELAEVGFLPLVLFTWAVPHMDDWGRITGEAREFKLLVCPGLDVTNKDVEEALSQIVRAGLWIRYTVEGKKCISVANASKWFKHQSYINKDKRNDDSGSSFPTPTENAEEHQETPQMSASFSLSFSPSFSSSPSPIEEPKEHYPISEIIDYLNLKAGTKYKASSKASQKHIQARCNEKYTMIDFQTVIDKKTAEWLGTDMEKYLCPDTLFGTKFEKYLNQKIVLRGGQADASKPESPRQSTAAEYYTNDAQGKTQANIQGAAVSGGNPVGSQLDLNRFVRR